MGEKSMMVLIIESIFCYKDKLIKVIIIYIFTIRFTVYQNNIPFDEEIVPFVSNILRFEHD